MHQMTRFAAVALVLAAWAAGPFAPGTAFASGVFDVAGVAVDVTADTAAQARERAIAEGERAAFRRLLERLTLRSDHSRLPELPRAELDEVREVAHRLMPSIELAVPLDLEEKLGTNWGALE